MTETTPPESKVSLLFRTFMALPMFLILSVIFWELILGAGMLSRWFYDHGWNVLGISTKIIGILLAVVTILLTVMVFVGWIMELYRVIRGRN